MHRAALLALALAATLALAACGSSGSAKKSTGSVAQSQASSAASFQTAFTRSSKVSVHAAFSGSLRAAGQSITLDGSGDIDAAAHKGTMDVGIALGGQRMPLSEVLDGKNVYVSSSLLSSFLPSGKQWLKVPLSSAAKTFGPSSFALTSAGTLPQLRNVRQVGSATIDGTKTVEYVGRIDLSKLPAASRAALSAGNATFRPVHVWIGSDGYVHRVRLATSSSAGGTQAELVLTTTLSKFGEQVSVTVPPASKTVDAGKIQIPGFGGQGV